MDAAVSGDELEGDRFFIVFHVCIIPQSKGFVQYKIAEP